MNVGSVEGGREIRTTDLRAIEVDSVIEWIVPIFAGEVVETRDDGLEVLQLSAIPDSAEWKRARHTVQEAREKRPAEDHSRPAGAGGRGVQLRPRPPGEEGRAGVRGSASHRVSVHQRGPQAAPLGREGVDVASISKRMVGSKPRYDVNYRDPDGRLRRKTFLTKDAAARYAAAVETEKSRHLSRPRRRSYHLPEVRAAVARLPRHSRRRHGSRLRTGCACTSCRPSAR